MGGLSLKTIDKKNIENFVKNDNREIDKKWVIWTAIINIAVFVISGYLGKNLILQIIAAIFILFILISFLFFLTKIEHCKKNYYLFYGMYACMFSLSFSMLSYGILKDIYSGAMMLMIADSMIDIVICVGTIPFTIWKIKKNKYSYKATYIVTAGIAAPSVLLGRSLRRRLGTEIVLGAALCVLGFVFAAQSELFVRYACIDILENTKD